MKRFISLAMASVMAASLLPATAFAATGDVKATAKVVGGENYTEDEMKGTDGKIDVNDAPELQLTFTTADYSSSSVPDAEIEMTLDKAEFLENDGETVISSSTTEDDLTGLIYLKDDDGTYTLTAGTDDFGGVDEADYAGQYIFTNSSDDVLKDASGNVITISDVTVDDVDELSFTLTGKMERGWVLSYVLTSQLTRTSKNTEATISVDSDDMVITNGDDLVYASIESKGISVSVKDTVDVAVEEVATLKDITIEPSVGSTFTGDRDDTLTLPAGVYATDVEVTTDNGLELDEEDFINAYDEGEYEYFEFDKRIFEENDSDNDPYELDVTFTLVADPDFEGDVVLTLSGDAMEEQEVTIAKFVKPYTVSAQQNDLTIDYRNTEIPTDVVITEAEAGLWEKGTEFALTLDKIEFDDDASVTPDDESGLSVKNVKTTDGEIRFTIDEESDDEPATVTVSDLTLYMDRSLPAGAYDLNAYALTMLGVDSAEKAESFDGSDYDADDKGYLPETLLAEAGTDVFVGDESDDIDYTVKAGFVNIVTAGSDTTGFTTKLTVPIGENYLIAGETQVTLDAPAYINAEGYTMLPVRAISTSLGIDNNNVLWDQATRTVTILYGDRIISMTAGSSVMYVNGSSIPTSSSVEIVNDRTFLPMRDMATALGVTDLTWDTDPTTGKTTTVYMNANR